MSAQSLKKFTATLRELSRVVAIKVATASAPVITDASRVTFAAGEDAYGLTWDPKADGTRATLVDTGALASGLRYTATGTKLRVALGAGHAKYQIGRRPVFPRQGASLPKAYLAALTEATNAVIRAEVAS